MLCRLLGLCGSLTLARTSPRTLTCFCPCSYALTLAQVLLQDLLQQQYQNIPTIRLFENSVVVNVNLLLFLINKKFLVGA